MRRRIFIAVALLLLIPVALVATLIYTPLGISLVAGQLGKLERIGIRIEGARGTFAGPLAIERFELDHPRVRVVAHDIVIDPQIRGLLIQTLRTRSITARDVEVQVREADMPPPERPPRFLPSFLRVDARGARFERVRYIHIDGRTIEANSVQGRVTITSHRLRVRRFQVDAERFDASGSLRLLAAQPLGIELTTEGTVQLQPELTVALNAGLNGTVERFAIDATIQKPSTITAQGVFAREADDWRVTGKISSPSFTLDPWLEQPPFSFTDIALDVIFDREHIQASGHFTVPEYELGEVGVDAHGRFADRVLHVLDSEFTLPGSPSRVRANGTLTFEGGPPNLELTARWTDLQWPLREEAVVRSPQGDATLRGTLPYEFSVAGRVDTLDAPSADGTATGTLAKDGLSIAAYDLHTLGGRITGRGGLQFAAPRAWTLEANAAELNPAALHPELPGSVSFRAISSGTGLNEDADFRLRLANVRGTLRGERLRGAGEVERRDRRWMVQDLSIALGAANLALHANLGETLDARWNLSTPAIERLWPKAHGSIDFSGTASGKRATPHIIAELRGRDLSYQGWSARTLAIDGDVDATNAQPSRLTIAAEQIGHGERLVQMLRANGTGTALDHRIAVEVVGIAQNSDVAPRAQMQVSGRYEEQTWTATIATTQFTRGNPAQELRIAEPAHVLVSRDRASLQDFCFVIAAGRLCAGGQWQRNGPWEGTISGYEIPLAFVLPSTDAEVEYAGRIEGSARLFGRPGAVWQGEAGMKISDAAIIYRPQGSEAETLNLGTGGMHLLAGPERISFSFGVQAFTDTFLHTNAQLIRSGGSDVMRLPLTGTVRARAADANLLPLLFPEVDRAAGLLTANATIAGSLAQPEINGRIELADGELDSYRVNFALRDLDLAASIDSNHLAFRGTGGAGEGRLEVEGDFRWNAGTSKGRVHLHGSELLVADLPEYRVVASPDLRFQIDRERIRVEGDVLIPSARVQPARLGGAVGPSDDARYVGEHPAEQDGRFTVASDVRVTMGKDVRVDAFGLHARIEGGVMTTVRTGAATTGQGELRVAEGRYEAYGQQLEINRGQLIFSNAPLDDPGLDIEARRRIETVTVGLNVRGTLQEPRLTFFSDPSMPQTQIVSYLLVGKPLNATAASEGEDLGGQSDTLALQGGGFLASQLGRRLGIEEVGIENYINSAGEANPSLVLGKFLSPRLFISYGISLTESINTLKLRYTISDRWIFRTESGEAQSADLEYTIER